MSGSHSHPPNESDKGQKAPTSPAVKAALGGLLSQTLIYGLSTVAVRLLNYVLVPIHTNAFTNQSDYGVISELYAWVTFLNVIFLYGMETAFFRFASKSENPGKVFGTAFGSLLISTSLFGLVMLLGAGGITEFLSLNGHRDFVVWFILIIALDTVAAIPFAWLRHASRPASYMSVKLLNVLVNVGLNVFFLLPLLKGQHDMFSAVGYSYNPSIGVGYVFIANLAASAITLLVLLPGIVRIKPQFDWQLWKRMMAYGSPFILAGLAGMVNETIDRIMLVRFLPDDIETNRAQVGIYSAVYKLSIFMTLAVQAFRLGAEPFFFRMSKAENARSIYASVMRAFVPLACLMFLVVSLWLDWFGIIIGPNYREGLFVVPVLLMANLFLGIYYNLSVWYKLTDRTVSAVWLSIAGATLTVGLNLWLIPLIGYKGSAWATLAAYSMMALLSWFWGQKHYPVPYPVISLLSMIVLAAAIYLGFEQIKPVASEPQRWILRIAGLALFAIFAWYTDSRRLISGNGLNKSSK